MFTVTLKDDPEDDCCKLLVIIDDFKLDEYSDCMEPEDATFTRDLSWVAAVIKQAYEAGYRDGSINYNNAIQSTIMLRAAFEAYDASGNLLPKQEYEVQSSFACTRDNYVMGVWVTDPCNEIRGTVMPLYLTQEQLNTVVKYEYY